MSIDISDGFIVNQDNEVIGVIVEMQDGTFEFEQVNGFPTDAATLRAVADKIDELHNV